MLGTGLRGIRSSLLLLDLEQGFRSQESSGRQCVP